MSQKEQAKKIYDLMKSYGVSPVDVATNVAMNAVRNHLEPKELSLEMVFQYIEQLAEEQRLT